ncbi:MAG: hypothetical protein HY537_09325 [Deltaproteobacteria bacterium]|nr:hypothetical protein [Deltaproteobacteria bacterium]
MNHRFLFLFLAAPFLCSCFLDKEDPGSKDPHVEKPAVLGVVAMIDNMRPTGAGASIVAGFFKKEQASAARLIHAEASREAKCALRTVQPSRDTRRTLFATSSSRSLKFLSAGAVSFGPAGQPSLSAIPQTASNLYGLALTPNFPAGFYSIRAEGAGDVPGFTDLLSVPEPMGGVLVNGIDVNNRPNIKKSEQLVLRWNAPYFPNGGNGIEFWLTTDTVELSCLIDESSLVPAGGVISWILPSSILTKLLVSSSADFGIERSHSRVKEISNLLVELRGSRQVQGPVHVQE